VISSIYVESTHAPLSLRGPRKHTVTRASRAHDRLARRIAAIVGATSIGWIGIAVEGACHVAPAPPPSGCMKASDCTCWQCFCQTVTTVQTAQSCSAGVCADGEAACAPLCASLSSTLLESRKSSQCGGDAEDAGTDAMPPVEECIDPPDGGVCPTTAFDVAKALEPSLDAAGFMVTAIDSGATMNASGQCCYRVELGFALGGGRPYIEDDRAVFAPITNDRGSGWVGSAEVCIDGLSAEKRAFRARAWAESGLFEHASVASFARFSLELLSVGAPSALVEAANRAALDEIEHARICFALASAYAGEETAPGTFPLRARGDVASTLVQLATRTVEEGCIGETLAAMIAAEQAERADDPSVREALGRIACDEAAHAELAWKTVAWAVSVGGDEVREAVARAFWAHLAAASIAEASTFGQHVHLSANEVREVVRIGRDVVIAPSARALHANADTFSGTSRRSSFSATRSL